MPILLTGTVMAVALSRTNRRVALRTIDRELALDNELQPVYLSAEEMLMYIAAGYEVHGSKRRVDFLCPPRPKAYIDRRLFDVDFSFQDGRACLKFWKDQRSPDLSA